eukprot:31419-Pelagococcus_subviridis.AAC.9
MAGIESEGWAERDDGQKSLRIGVHHANAVVWGPVYRTHLRGLPQPHLVRQDRPGDVLLVEQQQKVHADHLVRFQVRAERPVPGDGDDVVDGDERSPLLPSDSVR